MNKSIIITAEDLRLAKACKFQTKLFSETFPSGLPLTIKSIKLILSNEGFPSKPDKTTRVGDVNAELGWQLSYYLMSLLLRNEPGREETLDKLWAMPWGSPEERNFIISWFKENKAKLTAAVLKFREKELQANEK
jgi:hypothetical protein